MVSTNSSILLLLLFSEEDDDDEIRFRSTITSSGDEEAAWLLLLLLLYRWICNCACCWWCRSWWCWCRPCSLPPSRGDFGPRFDLTTLSFRHSLLPELLLVSVWGRCCATMMILMLRLDWIRLDCCYFSYLVLVPIVLCVWVPIGNNSKLVVLLYHREILLFSSITNSSCSFVPLRSIQDSDGQNNQPIVSIYKRSLILRGARQRIYCIDMFDATMLILWLSYKYDMSIQ